MKATAPTEPQLSATPWTATDRPAPGLIAFPSRENFPQGLIWSGSGEVPSWPSASTRQCTSDLKTGPCTREVRRYADAHGFPIVVNCLGLRASESPNRFKQLPWVKNEKRSTRKREWYDWLPIHNLFTDEVFRVIDRAGEQPHPAYALGMQRLSCVFCIYASPTDLRIGAIQRPELYEQYVGLEAETGYTMHMSRQSLPEMTGLSVKQAYQLNVLNAPVLQ